MKINILNEAGRLVLLKYSLVTLLVYRCSLCKVLRGITSRIERIRRVFLDGKIQTVLQFKEDAYNFLEQNLHSKINWGFGPGFNRGKESNFNEQMDIQMVQRQRKVVE